MNLPNFAMVGPAGVGKTTIANLLVQKGYRRHALADALKIGQGFIFHVQLGLPILGESPWTHAGSIQRITQGEMGTVNMWGDIIRTSHLYQWDIRVRDYLLHFVNENKTQMRTLLQQYGTEGIRGINEKIFPQTAWTKEEPWIRVVLKESALDNKENIPCVCDDVRYPHEAKCLKEDGWIIVRVERENATALGLTQENNQHTSEQMHRKIHEDICFYNSMTIEELPDYLEKYLLHSLQKETTGV